MTKVQDDVFEWDDATQKIVEKAVETRNLESATERLKDQAEDSISKNFNQYNFDEILRQRDQVIKSIQQVLSPKLSSFGKRLNQIEEAEDSEKFKRDREDNAIDVERYDDLREALDVLRSIHSLTTVWAYVAHANSKDVARAVDIQSMQADQNEALKMVNEHYDKFESAADRIARKVSDGVESGMKSVVEEVVEQPERRVEELEKKLEEKEERIQELEENKDNLVDPSELEPLTENQREIMEYMKKNPEAENSEIAEATDTAPNQVPTQVQRIKQKGWKIE